MTLSKYLVALALLGLLAIPAAADPYDTVAGFSTGIFPDGTPAGSGLGFNVLEPNQKYQFSDILAPGMSFQVGYFSHNDRDFGPVKFDLTLDFTLPDGAGNLDYQTTLTAEASRKGGDFILNFLGPTNQTVYFDGGSFDINLSWPGVTYPSERGEIDTMAFLVGTITDVNIVPEPASLLLFGSGLMLLGGLYRRRRRL